MKDSATRYVDWFNRQNKVVRGLICLLYDIPATIYRLAISIRKKDILGVILAIVLGLPLGWVMMFVDCITSLLMNKVYWIA